MCGGPLPLSAMFRRMMVVWLVGALGVVGGCSDDGDQGGGGSSSGGWLEQWPGEVSEVEGHQVKIDEDERVIYIEDCATARELTRSGGAYGPEDGEAGYGFVCDE